MSLILLSGFLMVPLTDAQTIQPVTVWTGKPTYQVGEVVTILWNTTAPCLNIRGVIGYLTFFGAGTIGRQDLTDAQLHGGSYTSGKAYTTSSIGSWSATLNIQVSGCAAQGSVTWNVTAVVPEFPSFTLSLLASLIISLLFVGRLRRRERLLAT